MRWIKYVNGAINLDHVTSIVAQTNGDILLNGVNVTITGLASSFSEAIEVINEMIGSKTFSA